MKHLDLEPIKTESEAVELTLTFMGFRRLGGEWSRPIGLNKDVKIWVGEAQSFKLATQHFGGRFFDRKADEIERHACLNISKILMGVHKEWLSRVNEDNVSSN